LPKLYGCQLDLPNCWSCCIRFLLFWHIRFMLIYFLLPNVMHGTPWRTTCMWMRWTSQPSPSHAPNTWGINTSVCAHSFDDLSPPGDLLHLRARTGDLSDSSSSCPRPRRASSTLATPKLSVIYN
jgi:hypothetical protein